MSDNFSLIIKNGSCYIDGNLKKILKSLESKFQDSEPFSTISLCSNVFTK